MKVVNSMHCKRCGALLPSSGYVCTECGTMMDLEQIKSQKEKEKLNTPVREMLSEKYGHKGMLYQKREEEKKSFKGILLLVGVVLLLILLAVLVYF